LILCMMAGFASGWFYDVMSLRLVAALEDIGVTELIVGRRRHAFLMDESALTEILQLRGNNVVCYHFGSMTEGTTTPGMWSDVDTLTSDEFVNIIFDWPEWEGGKYNLLMVKHATCSPQHYRLQATQSGLPLALAVPYDEYCVRDTDGRIYISNQELGHILQQDSAESNLPYIHSGPSHSSSESFDSVLAYRCRKLPTECNSWFTRPRPGNWPTPEMLQTARELGCFLVPDGHCDSEFSSLEWRVSPSLIERHLMFSMTSIHIQCYVTIKLLKKDIINPYLNGEGKLTSFHCKTALFFAREQLQPDMWTVDRLFDCVIYCLKLIRDWTIEGHFPHYIMDEVNLFDGKLNSEQRNKLRSILDIIIDTHLAPLAFVEADDLGVRLLHNVYTVAIWDMTPRKAVCQKITGFLSVYCNTYRLLFLGSLVLSDASANHTPDVLCMYLHSLITRRQTFQQLHRHHSEQTICRYDAVNKDCIRKYLYQHLASTAASICLQHGMQIGNRIWSWYSAAIDTDVASTRLKLASMLYCKGELMMAVDVLEDVERRYDNTVQAICGCLTKSPFKIQPRESFVELLYEEDTDVLSSNKVAHCVRFLRQEAFCAPPILHYEMVREVEGDFRHRYPEVFTWLEWAVVDSRPFLHYLKYLTFRSLGLRHRQVQAVHSLLLSAMDIQNLFHSETAMNLIGHCFEMEGIPDLALFAFQTSRDLMPRANAANLHIRRLTGVL